MRRYTLGAAIVATVALLGAGCIAPEVDDTTTTPPEAESPAATTGETPATESPTPVATYAPETLFQPQDLFEFERLPPPDISDWRTHMGELGTLQVSAPADWVVEIGVAQGLFQHEGQTWDWIQLTKPSDADLHLGQSFPGWARVRVEAAPFVLPSEDEVEGAAELIRKESVERRSDSGATGAPSAITITQYGQHTQFPDHKGNIVFEAEVVNVDDLFLDARGQIHFEATAEDIATVIAVLESAELVQ